MQHTDKYKFNIIDPSDDFSPDALNDNAKKLETALLEHKSETDAALSQHKSETNAALATHESTMNTRVAAVETAVDAGARFVKLGGGTANITGQTITFNLSGVNMNDYAALLMFSSANGMGGTGYLTLVLSINGITTINTLSGSITYTSSGLTVLQPIGSYVSAMALYGAGAGEGQTATDTGSVRSARITQKWASITSLSVLCAAVSSATVSLYGVKK